MSIPGQCLNDSLLMFSCILLTISTVITVTILITEDFLLEAFTIQFQTFRPFTITPNLTLTFHPIIFLLVHWWQETSITTLTALWKWLGWVTDCILYWEALVNTFLEWFTEGFGVEGVLCFEYLTVSLWVLSGTLVLHLGRDETLVWAWAVENFTEILYFYELLWTTVDWLHKDLIRYKFYILILMNEEFLEEILSINGTLFFYFDWLSDFR